MFNTWVVVRGDLSAEQARRSTLALLAMGREAQALRQPGTAHGWEVWVAEDEASPPFAQARAAVEDALAEHAEPPLVAPKTEDQASDPPAPIWTWRNTSSSVALAVLCVLIHLAVHQGAGPSARSTMLEAGAVAPWLVREGQIWRLLTAAFLHFDVKHLVGNMSTLFFLGAPLAAQVGHLRLGLIFVSTAIAGNITSQLLGNEAAIKAGASGGVCGLLGALAGVSLGLMFSAVDAAERRPAWQTLGALVALFGMIVGVEPGRDHYAHVGGVVAGVAIGWFFTARVKETPA